MTRPAQTPPDPTEARILAAARTVFTKKGTSGARMQDIAREAGVNQALLHYYFRTKAALSERVFLEAATRLFHAVVPPAQHPDTPLEAMLEAFVTGYIDTVRQTPFLPGYVLAETHQHPERVLALMTQIAGGSPAEAVPRAIAHLQRMIDARVATGELRPMKAEQLLVNLMALSAFPFVARPVLSALYGMDDASFDRFLDERRADLPRFLLNAIRA